MSNIIVYESTPNPQAMKFIVTDRQIADETVQFLSAEDSLRSPLARKLFGFPWAGGVLIGPNFVTVSKQEWVDWTVLAEPLANLIDEHVRSGEAVLNPKAATSDSEPASDDSPVVQQIKKILDLEIRPAVAMDGGDIAFRSFEDGRLYLEMQGSCSGCPSSMMTLKDGIEARLREVIPDVKEVISV